MKQRRLKRTMVPVVYTIAVVAVLGIAYMIEGAISNNQFKDEDHYGYVSKTIFDDSEAVVATETKVMRPYLDSELQIVKSYYDYKADAASQENALIFHENTYMQNSGVSYGGKENFDVVAILDGTVTNVTEDKLLGNVIEIKHDNDMISSYQSLSTVNVKKGDVVKQGQLLGKSGTSNISKELNDHLHFELNYKGANVNPEDYFDKKVSEL